MTGSQTTLTLARVNSLLDYDPASGEFWWRVDRRGTRIDQSAGTLNAKGYRIIRIDGQAYKAHRLGWLIFYGGWPLGQIDHIDGAPDNNRIVNLRLATHSENMRNRKPQINNTSGYVGVRQHRNGWQAHIGRIHLGSFKTIEEAIAARLEAETTHFKEFRRIQP